MSEAVVTVPTAADIVDFVKGGEGGYSSFAAALAWDVDAGVPGEPRVPLASVLREMRIEWSGHVEEPAAVLPAADRPIILPRPFIVLGMDFGLFVQKAVLVSLRRLVPRWKVWHRRGVLPVSRAFALPFVEKGAATPCWFWDGNEDYVVAVANAGSETQNCQG